MSPVIYSPVSPQGSLLDGSFDTMPFLQSSDSLCPLISSEDDTDHPSLFDSYIASIVEKDVRYSATDSTSDLSEGSRSSMDEGAMPLSPSQGTITQKSVRPRQLTTKRSIGEALKSLKPSSHGHNRSKTSKHTPPALHLDETSFQTVDSEDLPGSIGMRREEEDAFDDRNRTVRRRNMPHHPFRYEDVPYMQAYSQILLEKLLRRLCPNGSPTFHDYGKKPPSQVLDIGCGEGFWVLHAAKVWGNHDTKVTGLDLIDLHNNDAGEVKPQREPGYTPKNVQWKRGNFVKYGLEFNDNSFDLVRMANLTLCISKRKWFAILHEVWRVLKPGGRLELIDDDLFFPGVPPHPRLSMDLSQGSPRPNLPRTPSGSHLNSMPRIAALTRSASQRHIPDALHGPGSPRATKARHARSVSEVEYGHKAETASELEFIFDNMLIMNGIHAHPHLFLIRWLHEVFGPKWARETQKLELAVPSRALMEGVNFGPKDHAAASPAGVASGEKRRSEDGEKGRPSWLTIDSKKDRKAEKEKEKGGRAGRTSEDGLRDPKGMDGISPKARQLLFGDDKARATPPSAGPYQPPGIVLLPHTFIPCSPLELEMHACKNMNTLLGCKYALSKFMMSSRGEKGEPLVSERDVDDYLWDYECFRRKRFNWPQDIPSLRMIDEEPEHTHAPPFKSALLTFGTPKGLAPMYAGLDANKKNTTHVRTIRVYEAMKMVADQ
ncbi:uncharacterized protein TRAVEDRAFT_68021 [Trametes versicolor FP-101664 SS1]|uniref:uncharacterized protein n=1 Tax=Trametes versicolor (strain FP-101664) TaxID=717944 RepID=UPI0004622915|nr:uncharacterized protein TRAVEDRAFT_68021 [Trametes versicolor FP-101664 SS1]EIW64149.1 hypothetical protein TRAVEDRAFT_68021 [Trametes versicolor FP-101664 SS1]